jgi:hypothetical protein
MRGGLPWIRLGIVLLLGAVAALAHLLPPGLRDIAFYPALGLFPGMVVSRHLAPREDTLHRWVLGLALSPLLSALGGLLCLGLGMAVVPAAATIAGATWLGWLLIEASGRPCAGTSQAGTSGSWLPWALGFAALLALLPLLNRWFLVRSDSWFHAGLVWEVVLRGIPPENPTFAGPPGSYMWCYHVFVALLTGAHGDPFVAMATLNVVDGFLLVAMVHRLGFLLWRDERAAAGGVALTLLGLNAGAWLLWPLRLLLAFTGDVVGWPEIDRLLRAVRLQSDEVIFSLSAPFAHMVSLLDKFTLGTALNYAWVLLLLYLWGTLSWLDGGRRGYVVCVALATMGLFLFHGVVALSAVPVLIVTMLATLVLRRRWRWLPASRRLAALLAATAAGMAVGLPYLMTVSQGWSPERSGLRHQYLRPGLVMPWTLVTSMGIVLWLARRPLARVFRERAPGPAIVAMFAAAMTLFALVVHLPGDNETKFVFQIFFAVALFGGVEFFPWLSRLVARRGHRAAATVFGLLFLVGPALTVSGYVSDRNGRVSPRIRPSPGEERLYEWIRNRTETDAVFLDDHYCDLVMVHGRRPLYLGSASGSEQFAFPLQELLRRRAVMADVYGPCGSLARDAEALGSLRRPIYLLYRPWVGVPERTTFRGLERRPDLFSQVLARDGYRVYRLRNP